eukprot:2008869-Pyramimonas_sp.AAC.1
MPPRGQHPSKTSREITELYLLALSLPMRFEASRFPGSSLTAPRGSDQKPVAPGGPAALSCAGQASLEQLA